MLIMWFLRKISHSMPKVYIVCPKLTELLICMPNYIVHESFNSKEKKIDY